MAKWIMTPEHAAHAAVNPPRAGYTCGAHAETNGGGCFNCGFQVATEYDVLNGRFVRRSYNASTLKAVQS